MLSRTLLLTTLLQLLLLVAVSVPSWRKANADRFIERVGSGVALMTVALALFTQRGALSGALTVVGANVLLLTAHQVWLEALYRLCRVERRTRRAEAALAASGGVLVAALWAADPSVGELALSKPRIVAATLPMIVSGVLWIRALYRGAARPLSLGQRYLTWAALVSVGLNLTRVGTHLASDGTIDPLRARGSIAVIVLLNLMGVFTAFGLILEIEARARASLEHDNTRLAADALTDPLTGLGNRRRLEQQTDALIAAARRGVWPVSVLVLDIDHFKAINDRFGHAAGDAVLREVARHCSGTLREQDLLLRWGGEEFAAILPRCDAAAAAAVSARILAAIRGSTALPADAAPVTASVGIAVLDLRESTFTDAIRRADAAMYQAKRAGRDRYVVHG